MVKKMFVLLFLLIVPCLFLFSTDAPSNQQPTDFQAHQNALHTRFLDDERNAHLRAALDTRYEALLKNAPTEAERLKIQDQKTAELQGQFANGGALGNAVTTGLRYEGMMETAKWLIRPQTAGFLALVFGAWHGTSFLKNTLDRWSRIPPLAQRTSIRSWYQKITGLFIGHHEEKLALEDVILEPKLTKKIAELTEAIKNTVIEESYLRHFLFYGPSGTGKTMVAQAIADNAGLEYIYFSAAKLELYTIEEGLNQLTHLFEFAQSYGKKLLIIMDEAEVLFGKRETMCDKTYKLLDALLTYTGTESKHFMVIAITNRPARFDGAVLNRFGEKIKIGRPGLEERKRLLSRYFKKYLIAATEPKPDTRTFLGKLVTSAPEQKPLSIAAHVMTQAMQDDFVAKLDGFVGRDIADLMLAVQGAAYALPHRTVTQALMCQKLEDKIEQRQEELNDFQEMLSN